MVVKLKMRIQYQNRKFIRNWTKVATISYLSLDGGNFIKIFVAKVHTLVLLSTNCIVAKRNNLIQTRAFREMKFVFFEFSFGRAEILVILGLYFGRNDDLINSF